MTVILPMRSDRKHIGSGEAMVRYLGKGGEYHAQVVEEAAAAHFAAVKAELKGEKEEYGLIEALFREPILGRDAYVAEMHLCYVMSLEMVRLKTILVYHMSGQGPGKKLTWQLEETSREIVYPAAYKMIDGVKCPVDYVPPSPSTT